MPSGLVLVSMPFAPPQRPSIALGILKALAIAADISTEVLYPNLWFAEDLGFDDHDLLTGVSCEEGLVEWLFAPFAFPEATRDDAQFIERLIARNPAFPIRNIMRLSAILGKARKAASRTLDRTVEAVIAAGPVIVGCTSMFQQHVASLALLRRLKDSMPGLVTMMGGPNCETRMGQATHRNYPWVDFIVSGEAEELFVPLLRGIFRDGVAMPAAEVPFGVFAPCHRTTGYPGVAGGDGVQRATVTKFNSIPLPDFTDYFIALEATPSRELIVPSLPIETARGCWWGAQSHCTFCGLNGTSMTFRSKPPERVVAEIAQLNARYGVANMNAVDNIIDIRYFESVFPELARQGSQVRLFYETKSNLKRQHLRAARDANVVVMQPGIESLSSAALKHMGKGVQAWQNIQYLRLAAEQGIRTIWLNLVAFPDEDDGWHAEAAALFPLLTHLEPGMVTRVRYDRYSPLFNRAHGAGISLRPAEAYQHIYPVTGQDLFDQTYFFEADPCAPIDDAAETWTAPRPQWAPGAFALFKAARDWRREWQTLRPVCAMIVDDGHVRITDSRSCAPVPELRLGGLEGAVLLAADMGVPEHRLCTELATQHDTTTDRVFATVDALVAGKLAIRIDDRVLALPTLGLPRRPVPNHHHPLGMVRKQERSHDGRVGSN